MGRKIGILITGLLLILVIPVLIWLEVTNKPKPKAPDLHMVTECDSFITALHVYNTDTKPIRYSTKLYVDVNDNQLLDNIDTLLYTEDMVEVAPAQEHHSLPLRMYQGYKSLSVIAEVTTDDMIVYYASVPCSEQSPSR